MGACVRGQRVATTAGFLSILGTRRLQLRLTECRIPRGMIGMSVEFFTAVLDKEEDLFDAALGAIRFAERK